MQTATANTQHMDIAIPKDRAEKAELLMLLEERDRRKKTRKIATYYPETGPLRRELYVPHCGFFAAGAEHRERLMLAANRVGKSEGVGGYEVALHLTGNYPEWWTGRRFDEPVRVWAAGDTSQTVREIIQEKLMGPPEEIGTGLIPGDLIVDYKKKAGSVPDAIESVYVKHVSGGVSRLVFKSYDQKRKAFQGTEQDVIWLDEEPPYEIYTECLLRTMTTNGVILCTFTPLLGLSETVLAFLPGGKVPQSNEEAVSKKGKFIVMATWDDAPHLTDEQKEELWESIPPYQRDARSKGIPQLGAGAIYPVPEDDITVEDFEIPEYWPRAYAMDVGWNRTAALWGAWDRESDTVYFYSCHSRGEAEPVVHAQSILSRGDWIPGVIDPASRGRGQKDGERLYNDYIGLGLALNLAENAVEAGIYAVWTRLSAGRIKVFKSLRPFFEEYRIYRRDEKGKIVKENDHLMDCMRYWILSAFDIVDIMPFEEAYGEDDYREDTVNPITGY